jgi:hypothetical protein
MQTGTYIQQRRPERSFYDSLDEIPYFMECESNEPPGDTTDSEDDLDTDDPSRP